MTGRSKVRIFAPGGRRVGAVPPRALHAPPPTVAPNGRVITREHDNAIQNTPPSTHYTVACALLYSGYPHVRLMCAHRATTPKRTLPMPKPPRLRGPLRPSSSFRLMRDRTPSLMASLWASPSSSFSRTHHHHACHAFLASRHVPTSRRARRRPPYHASNTSNARRPVWSFGHLVIWSSFSRAVGPRRTCRCIHRQVQLRGGGVGEGGCGR